MAWEVGGGSARYIKGSIQIGVAEGCRKKDEAYFRNAVGAPDV